jgi:hypothetical protein
MDADYGTGIRYMGNAKSINNRLAYEYVQSLILVNHQRNKKFYECQLLDVIFMQVLNNYTTGSF